MMRPGLLAVAVLACLAAPAHAADGDERLLGLHRKLVGIDTSFGSGDCTAAARAARDFLFDAGLPPQQAEVFEPEGHPREGGLIAQVKGRDPALEPILLIGHLDVVAADAKEWGADPFTLRHEGDRLIGRGANDMKSLIAVWLDSLAKLAADPPARGFKLALTCGEEGLGLNGLRWLIANRPEAIRAAYALNEGGGGRVDDEGRLQALYFQVLEKTYADFGLRATGKGGHSSVPLGDNPIVRLGRALDRIAQHRFALRPNPVTLAFLERAAAAAPAPLDEALARYARNPADSAAAAIVTADPEYAAMLSTTCAITRFAGGHANNALPETAEAVINCRILPGESAEDLLAELVAVADDPAIAVAPLEGGIQVAPRQELPTRLVAIAEAVAAQHFPGVPVIPMMTVAASDSPALILAGVPTYGVPGIALDARTGNRHAIDEWISASALTRGSAYIHDLLRALGEER